MPIFLDVEELVDLYRNELPEDQWAQDRADDPDPAKRSYSSSDIRSSMTIFEDLEVNLASIYEDKWASTVGADGLRRWEVDNFPRPIDVTQPLVARRANLLAQIRTTGGISYDQIYEIIQAILSGDPGVVGFDLIPLNGLFGGVWIFEESLLDVDTFLSPGDPLVGGFGPTALNCDGDYAAAGLTLEQYRGIQFTAYVYEVRIHGIASQMTLDTLEIALTEHEPARSDHIIRNDFDSYAPVPPEDIYGGDFTQLFFYALVGGAAFTDTITDEVYGGNFL